MNYILIAVDGADESADLEALAAWFAAEPELRGLIKAAAGLRRPGEPDAVTAVVGALALGGLSGVLVAAMGAGGAVSVLAASLKTFFAQPRGAKVRIVVTRADGSRLELDADRVKASSVADLTERMITADRGLDTARHSAPALEAPAGDES